MTKPGFAFTFDPTSCWACDGRCCKGDSGYIWIDQEEIEAICSYLGLSKERFFQEYGRKVSNRWSLKEVRIQGEYWCIFAEERGCAIYPVRPKQCRDYPFWERYKGKRHLDEVVRECRGIILD